MLCVWELRHELLYDVREDRENIKAGCTTYLGLKTNAVHNNQSHQESLRSPLDRHLEPYDQWLTQDVSRRSFPNRELAGRVTKLRGNAFALPRNESKEANTMVRQWMFLPSMAILAC